MKRPVIAVLGVLLAAGCSGSSSSTTSPSPNGPGNSTIRFTAALSPSNETPPITNAESVGSGTATIDFNITRDANSVITAASVNFSVNMSGFPSTTVINIAHIHTGAAGVAGGVLVSTTLAAGEVVLSGGAGTFTRVGITMTSTVAQSIIDNPAGFYFNVHSTLNPGGVIRGQLVRAN